MEKHNGVNRYEVEAVFKVCDNKLGGFISVGDDRDGLGMIEIVSSDRNEDVSSISMDRDQARLLIVAMTRYLESSPDRDAVT